METRAGTSRNGWGTDCQRNNRLAAGYTIVNADNIDEAEKLLANCPIITSVVIYEAISM